MKRIILILLICFSGLLAQSKQSLYSNYPGLIFREVFNSEADTRANGGVPTSVTYSNGVGVFNGSSSTISCPKPNLGKRDFTIRIKLYATALNKYIMGEYLDNNNRWYISTTGSGTKLTMYTVRNGASGVALKSTDNLPINTWLDICIVTTRGVSTIAYINGTLISTSIPDMSALAVDMDINTFTIGSWQGSGSSFFTGSIDYVEIYNRALTASEISNLYNGVAYRELPSNTSEVLGSAIYTSNFSAGTDSWSVVRSVVDGNIDGIAGKDNTLRIYANNANDSHYAYDGIACTAGLNYKVSLKYYIPSSNTNVNGFKIIHQAASASLTGFVTGSTLNVWTTLEGRFTADVSGSSGKLGVLMMKGALVSFAGANSVADDLIYIKDFVITPITSSSTPTLINFDSRTGIIKDLQGKLISNTSTTIKRSGSIWSASFSGTTSKIDYGTFNNLTGDLTICAWVKVKSLGGGLAGRIIDNGKLILWTSSTTTNFKLSSDGATTSADAGASTVVFSKWLLLIATRTSSGVVNFYIGTPKTVPTLVGTANQSSGTPATGTTNITIGNRSANDRGFDGLISRVRVDASIWTTNQMTQFWSNSAKDYQ